MRHMSKATLGRLGDVQERREDEVLNTKLLCYVCDVLALSDLSLRVCGLPVIGDQEDGVRVLKCSLEAVFGVQVRLNIEGKHANMEP
jgi:hypothetical protein